MEHPQENEYVPMPETQRPLEFDEEEVVRIARELARLTAQLEVAERTFRTGGQELAALGIAKVIALINELAGATGQGSHVKHLPKPDPASGKAIFP